jgi:hypothetical protein
VCLALPLRRARRGEAMRPLSRRIPVHRPPWLEDTRQLSVLQKLSPVGPDGFEPVGTPRLRYSGEELEM